MTAERDRLAKRCERMAEHIEHLEDAARRRIAASTKAYIEASSEVSAIKTYREFFDRDLGEIGP